MDLENTFWEETYQRNIKKMIGICFRYVTDRQIAEDLAHDAFLSIMHKAETFKGKGHFDAWIRKITVNTALMYLRENKRKKNQQELLTQYLSNNNEDRSMWHDFTIQNLQNAINTLPEHHRLVFNLYVIDNYSHKEIADNLNISPGTSKSHLARARKKLQLVLNETEQEKRKRTSFFFLLFPCGFGKIDRIYKKSFFDYEIPPQNTSFLKTTDWTKTKLPRFTLYSSFITGTVTIGIISIITVIVVEINSKTIDLKNNSDNKEVFDTTIIKADSIYNQETTDTTIQTKPLQKPNIVVVKKKRITHKKVIVRDTLTILDTTNVE